MAEHADVHAMRRARERYDRNLTRQELEDAANIIKKGCAHKITRHPGGSVYALCLNGAWLFVLWGSVGRRDGIKSVLPPGKHYRGRLINHLKQKVEKAENEVERLYGVLAEVRGAFPLPGAGPDEDEESSSYEEEVERESPTLGYEVLPREERIKLALERRGDDGLERDQPLDAWEEQIARDSEAGRLDDLAEKALADYRAGRTEPL